MLDIVEAILEPGWCGPCYGGRIALAMRRCYSAEDHEGFAAAWKGAFPDKMSNIPNASLRPRSRNRKREHTT